LKLIPVAAAAVGSTLAFDPAMTADTHSLDTPN
jgi:hypothetical protein